MWCILAVALTLIAVAVIIGAWKDKKDEKTTYGTQFRIVELKNGMYEVQQFRCKWNGLDSLKEWARPEDDRTNIFNTLEEARAYKARLVADMRAQSQYNLLLRTGKKPLTYVYLAPAPKFQHLSSTYVRQFIQYCTPAQLVDLYERELHGFPAETLYNLYK